MTVRHDILRAELDHIAKLKASIKDRFALRSLIAADEESCRPIQTELWETEDASLTFNLWKPRSTTDE